MKKFLLCVIVAGFAIPSFAQPSKEITLQAAIDLALKNNPETRQRELFFEAASINKRQSVNDLLPDLNANANHGINEGRSIDPFTNSYNNQRITYGSYSLGSSLIVFNGLLLQHNLKQNRLALEASREEWQQVKDALTLNVILTYLQILSNEEQLTSASQQLEVTRKQVERLTILNKEGAIAPALLYDLQGQQANDELAVVNSRNNLNASKLQLARLMNVPFNRDLKVAAMSLELLMPDEMVSADSVYTLAAARLSIIKAAELRKAAAEQGVKSAKSGFYPAIGLNGNLFTNYSSGATRDILVSTVEKPSADFVTISGSKFSVIRQQSNYSSEKISYSNQFKNNYSSSLSVGIRIPLLNGFRTRNQVALAKIQLKDASINADNNRILLRQQVEEAHLNMNAAYERFQILNRQLISFQASFRNAEVKFNAGVGTQIDYLIAKNNLDRSNFNLITAKYDYLLRKKIINFYLGY